jgi:CBS domain-containing protein
MTGAAPESDLAHVRVEEVMHSGLVTCTPGTSLRTVARILAAHRIHAVVVADERAHEAAGVWGVVSDADVICRLAAGSLDEAAGIAAELPPCFVTSEDTVEHAAAEMAAHNVTHLIVVDLGGRPVGVLSSLDVAEAASR